MFGNKEPAVTSIHQESCQYVTWTDTSVLCISALLSCFLLSSFSFVGYSWPQFLVHPEMAAKSLATPTLQVHNNEFSYPVSAGSLWTIGITSVNCQPFHHLHEQYIVISVHCDCMLADTDRWSFHHLVSVSAVSFSFSAACLHTLMSISSSHYICM